MFGQFLRIEQNFCHRIVRRSISRTMRISCSMRYWKWGRNQVLSRKICRQRRTIRSCCHWMQLAGSFGDLRTVFDPILTHFCIASCHPAVFTLCSGYKYFILVTNTVHDTRITYVTHFPTSHRRYITHVNPSHSSHHHLHHHMTQHRCCQVIQTGS